MFEKFKSISTFMNAAKSIEEKSVSVNVNKETSDAIVQQVLNESAVKLSVLNNMDKKQDFVEAINKGIKESVEINANRIKSKLDDLFSSTEVSKEREEFWVNKLCTLFNIDEDLSMEDKIILIDKQLSEDEDTLNYITFLMERSKDSK